MRLFYTLIFSTILCLSLNAQTIWTGDVDTDWNNPGNWSAGIPTSGMTVTIPGSPTNGNFPVYSGNPVIDFTIQNAGTITFDDFVYNNGTIVNFNIGTLVNNNNYFVNAGSVVFDNDGSFTNTGTFENFGTFDNAASATFTNASGATLINQGLFRNNGAFENNGIIINNGMLRSTDDLQNNSTIENYGFIENPFGSVATNSAGSSINNYAGSEFGHNGTFQNDGSISNDGRFEVQNAGVFTHDGSFSNNGHLEISGELINNTTLINNGTAKVNNAGTLNNKSNFANNGSMETAICGTIIQNSSTNISGPVLHDGIIYQLQGSVDFTNVEFGEVFSDLSQTKPPVPGCKSGGFVQLDENGAGTLALEVVDKGGYGQCGASIVTKTLSQTEYTLADLGAQNVTLTVEDDQGNTASCVATIFIVEYVPPIVAVDDPDIDFACPSDITVTPEAGAAVVEVSWTEPAAPSTTCVIDNPNPNPPVSCSSIADEIAGYIYLGEYNNSKYYCSNSNAFTWAEAKIQAASIGGHLAIVEDLDENEFIRQGIIADYAWIGLTDEQSEGTYKWVNGEVSNFYNWNSGEPNNSGGIEDYVRLLKSNGKWTDRDQNFEAEFVVEIPCSPVPSCSSLSNSISGFIFVGEYNDSKYYLSDHTAYWSTANTNAQNNGGHLVSINDAGENGFIQSNINPSTGSIWIGFNTVASSGTFQWQNGDPVSYTNWQAGEPNGSGVNYAARMKKSSGEWTDRQIDSYAYEYLMEIPCSAGGNETCEQVSIAITLDNYTSETSWEIVNANGGVEASGGGYGNYSSGDSVFDEVCLEDGCYDFIIYDSYGDGICCQYGNGSYTVTKEDGTVVASGGSFTTSESTNFCISNDDGGVNADPVVQKISGPANGGFFGIGVTEVAYRVTDDCGNEEICIFTVTVEENPADVDVTCPDNITVDAEPGAASEAASWVEPTASTTCYKNGIEVNRVDEGPANGGLFPTGTTFVSYAVTDSCNNFTNCVFSVTVNEILPVLTLESCPGNFTTDADNFTWDAPTASTSCFTGNIEIEQVEGPAIGSNPADGVYTIAYLINDECENSEICIFTVTVAPTCAPQGTPCDDGDDCTTGDVEDGNCNCAGIYTDSDGDGVCDADDICEGGDDSVDVDGDGIPDFCDDCSVGGQPCDDGDDCTEGDVYDADCNCAGVYADSDGDGVCNADDICNGGDDNMDSDGDGIPDFCDDCTVAGQPCDDNDASTINDRYDADCNCIGEPTTLEITCPDDVSVTAAAGETSANVSFDTPVVNSDCIGGYNIQQLTGAPSGSAYDLGVTEVSFNVTDQCTNIASCSFNVTVLDGGCLDSDGDGVCNADDICEGGDDNMDSDGDGIPDFCDDCNDEGQPCDDGDDCTEGDVYDADCNCAGVYADSDGDGVCNAEDICNGGDDNMDSDGDGIPDFCDEPSDDPCADVVITLGPGNVTVSNLTTPIFNVFIFNSGWGTEYNCAYDCTDPTSIDLAPGTYYIKVSLADASWAPICDIFEEITITEGCNFEAGTPCNDGDDCTSGDVYDDNCNCAGVQEPDSDGDGVCDALDQCEGGDDTVDMDGDGTPDFCDSCVDNDGDGVCNADDICEGGDDNVDSDGDGTPDFCDDDAPPSDPCANVIITLGPGNVTVSNLTTPIYNVFIFDSGWGTEYNCAYDCTDPTSIDLAPGTYYIKVSLADASWAPICDIFEEITITEGCNFEAGTPCNDGDDCTSGDVYDDNCNCAGVQEPDSDGDGVCDALDQCEGGDDTVDMDGDGTPDFCDSCVDNDGDGVCNADDICEGGDDNVDSDGDGTPDFCDDDAPPSDPCANVQVEMGSGTITVSGIDAPIFTIMLFNDQWQTVYNCGYTCESPAVIEGLDAGIYHLSVKLYDASWSPICEVSPRVDLASGAGFLAGDEIFDFQAHRNGRVVSVYWATNSEVRNDHFVVEHSSDGQTFEALKNVTSITDDRGAFNYFEKDEDPYLGANYYRLAKVHKDGSVDYSVVRRVDFDIDLSETSIFPNPATNEVYVSLEDFAGRSATISIFNQFGQRIDMKVLDVVEETPYRFNTSRYKAGTYTIYIEMEGTRNFARKFVIARL